MHLLKHFKELTIRPKNAHELKGLILQLAVQGKLTSQWRKENPNTTSSVELIKRIKSYNEDQLKLKNRRVKKVKIENQISLDLPNGWVQVRNFELFNLQKGRNPKDLSETIKKHAYQDIEALDRGNVRRYSDDEKAPKCSNEDILVVCDGSRSGLVLEGKEGIVGSTLAIIETPPFIKQYIKIIFLQDYQRANDNMIGAAIPHLDTKNLLQESIGLPPLEEQKAIVEVVETLFKEVEQLEQLTVERITLKEDFVTSALNQLTANNAKNEWAFLQDHFNNFFNETNNIKKLRETILQLAVQGKLTRTWRASHPELVSGSNSAKELLKRIQEKKAQLIKEKKIKKEKPLPTITKDEIPFDLPEGWVWCRLGSFTSVNGGKRLPKGERLTREDTGFIYLRVTDMKNGTVNESDLHYLSPEAQEIIKQYTISKDELYLTIVGATIGKLGSIPDKFDGINLTENAVKINSYLNVKDYIQHILNTKFIQNQFLDKTLQVGVPKLAMHRINKTLFPLAPFEEQKVIVQKVNAIMGLCDALDQQVKQSQEQSEQIMQSVLREVFEGKKELETV